MPFDARRPLRIELTPRTLLIAVAVLAGAWLLMQLWFVVTLVMVALVMAGTLHPLVLALERLKLPRSLALALVFIGLTAVVVLLALVTVPPLITELLGIVEKAPALQAQVSERMQASRLLRPLALTVKEMRAAELMSNAGQHVVAYGSRIAVVLGELVTILFLALYILAGREREQAAVFSVVPRRYHLRLARIMLNLETIVGGYVRGQIITSVAITGFTFVLLTVLGVRNALALAVFAGLTDIIPFVGGLIAGTPVVLAALSKGLPTAVLVLVLFVVYQEFESRILVPRVYGKVLRLSPVMVIVALMIGATLMGVVGALLALPIAAGIRMIAVELRLGMPGDDFDDRELRERDDAAEREFAERAAGTRAGDAAQIATHMAEDIRRADAPGDEKAAAEVPITGGRDDESSQPA